VRAAVCRPVRMSRRVLLVLTLCAPGILAALVALNWQRRNVSPVTGDEPHYLIIADAITRDGTVDIDRAYRRDAIRHRIIGPIDRHSVVTPRGTFSIHNLGLPLIIAPLFRSFGIAGARISVALITAALPFVLFSIARRNGVRVRDALWLALGCSLGMPFLVGAGQIFPDLPTGILVVALIWLLRAQPKGEIVSGFSVVTAGVLAGVLPWLHLKNLPVMAVLLVAIGIHQRRRATTAVHELLLALPVACSLGLLALYNWHAFRGVLGPYTADTAVGASLEQATMIFAGLHFDQAQGIFFQHPLLFFGLCGLPALWRRDKWLALVIWSAYLVVLIPNAFHTTWYGGYSISGRFFWSVAPLWCVAFVYTYVESGSAQRRLLNVLLTTSIIWQAFLLARFARGGPAPLYTVWTTSLVGRNTTWDRRWDWPSFYDFDRYLTYSPNGEAVMISAAVLILAIGCWGLGRGNVARQPRSHGGGARTWGRTCLAGLVVCGLGAAGAWQMRPRSGAFDLLQQWSLAEKRSVGDVSAVIHLQDIQLDGVTRSAVCASATSRFTWTFRVPRMSVLRTWTALEVAEGDPVASDIVFRVSIADRHGYEDLFLRTLSNGLRSQAARWTEAEVDLSRYAGRDVALMLNTGFSQPRSESERGVRACWGGPTVATAVVR
jgi:hypothetical protein